MAGNAPARYEEWLEFVFGRTGDDTDPFEMDWDFDAPPDVLADLFVWTMENSGRDLERFSDHQVSLGLQGLLFSDFSGIPHELIGPGVPEDKKIAVIRSLGPLYRDCLCVRSADVLGHLNETAQSPLEYVTYMLWDVTVLDTMARKEKARLDVLLDVLSATIRLPNGACVESALHGLGHMGRDARPKASSVIDRWLEESPPVRPDLLAYAKRAREGRIL
jgi:hypothetical protein